MRFIRFLLIIAVLFGGIAGVLWGKRDALLMWAAKDLLAEFHQVPVSVESVHLDWPRRTVQLFNLRAGNAADDTATVRQAEIRFDLSQIRSRIIDLPSIEISGLTLKNKGADGVLFRFLKQLTKKSGKPPPVKVTAGDLVFKNLDSGDFDFGEAQARIRPSELTFDLRNDTEKIVLAGDLDLEIRLPQALKTVSSFRGNLKVAGILPSPEIEVNLAQAAPGAVGIRVQAKFKSGVLTLTPRVDSLLTAISGEIDLIPASSLIRVKALSIDHFPLKSIHEAVDAAELSLRANGEFSFVRLDGALSADLDVQKLTLPGVTSARGRIRIAEQRILAEDFLLAGPGGEIEANLSATSGLEQITGEITTPGFQLREKQDRDLTKSWITGGGAIQVSGSAEELKSSGIIALTMSRQRLGERIRANIFTLPIRIDLAGNPRSIDSLHGEVEISPFAVPQIHTDVRVEQPTRITVSGLHMNMEPVPILAGDHQMELSGTIGKEGYELALHGAAEVGALIGDIPGVEDVRGYAALELTLGGPLNEPDLNGRVVLSDGYIAVPAGEENISISEIAGEVHFKESSLTVGPIQSASDEGGLLVEGSVTEFLDPTQRAGTISVQLRNLSALPLSGMTARGKTQLALTLKPGARPLLEGTVTLDEVLYEQKTDLNTLLKQVLRFFRSKKIPVVERSGVAPTALPFDLEVSIRGERSIVFDTDFLQAELSSDIRLHSVEREPRLSGQISSDSGELNLGKARLVISKASVRFDNTPLGDVPEIELRAEGELGARGAEEFVQLEITGGLPSPEVRLRSETGRSDRELLGLLGLGFDRLKVVQRSDERIAVGELLNPFSGVGLADRLTGITGVSNVEIESGYSADTGEFAPQLRLERPLPYDFSLVGKSELSQFNRSSLNLEYPLTEQTKVFLGWQNAPTTRNPNTSSGSTGAGLHYRERFGGTSLFPGELLLDNLRGLIP